MKLTESKLRQIIRSVIREDVNDKQKVNKSDAVILNVLSGNQVGNDRASDFLSKHKVDLGKLKKAKMQGVINSYDIRDVVNGKAHSLITKNFFKNYVNESVNEAKTKDSFLIVKSKTYEMQTQKGTLLIDVDEDWGGVNIDIIFNNEKLTNIDLDFNKSDIKIKQKQKKLKLK